MAACPAGAPNSTTARARIPVAQQGPPTGGWADGRAGTQTDGGAILARPNCATAPARIVVNPHK
eukprot:11779217-Alexandrium_andersonii.AAC.1